MMRVLKIAVLIILLYILCNINALAKDEISKLTKTVLPTDGEGNAITITTADKFDGETLESISLYFQIEGLDFQTDEAYATLDVGEEKTPLKIVSVENDNISWFRFNADELENVQLNQTNKVRFFVHNLPKSVIYNVEFDIWISNSVIIDNDISNYIKAYTSENQDSIMFRFSTVSAFDTGGYDGLNAKLVDSNNVVYAVTNEKCVWAEIWNISFDKRYSEVFNEKIWGRMGVGIDHVVWLDKVRPMKQGNYSIVFFEGDTEKDRIENAVCCAELAKIDARGEWGSPFIPSKRISLHVELSEYVEGAVILAAYNNGSLVGVDTVYERGTDECVNCMYFDFYYTQQPDCIKIMFFEDFITLTPLCLPVEAYIFEP